MQDIWYQMVYSLNHLSSGVIASR